jgi:hypothetical protein
MSDLTLTVRQELPFSPFPVVKPPPARTRPEVDNTGWAVFAGGSSEIKDIKYQYNASFSRSMEQEKTRISDHVRVKQKTKDPATGKEEVNEENYIDVAVPKEIQTVNDADGTAKYYKYNEPYVYDVPSNVEPLKYDVREENKGYVDPDITNPGTVGRAAPTRRRNIRRF